MLGYHTFNATRQAPSNFYARQIRQLSRTENLVYEVLLGDSTQLLQIAPDGHITEAPLEDVVVFRLRYVSDGIVEAEVKRTQPNNIEEAFVGELWRQSVTDRINQVKRQLTSAIHRAGISTFAVSTPIMDDLTALEIRFMFNEYGEHIPSFWNGEVEPVDPELLNYPADQYIQRWKSKMVLTNVESGISVWLDDSLTNVKLEDVLHGDELAIYRRFIAQNPDPTKVR
jgi:hypothetical protein